MSRNQRLTMLALAAVVVVVALVILPGGDEEADTQPAAQTTEVEQPASTAETAPATTEAAPEPARKPKPPLLQAGKERELEFEKGDTIRFRVRHPSDEEIHVHGYDESKPIKGGQTATMSFEADLEGIFEVELEHSGTPLGTIKVEPN